MSSGRHQPPCPNGSKELSNKRDNKDKDKIVKAKLLEVALAEARERNVHWTAAGGRDSTRRLYPKINRGNGAME